MSIQIENQHLLENALLVEGTNLLFGAGFPILAQDAAGLTLPVGTQLESEIRNRFDLPGGLTLPMMSSILEAENRDSFQQFLIRRFSVASFDPRYLVLDDLEIKNILTTNIDDLAFHIYRDSKRHYINDKLRHGSVYRDRAAINYLPLHGCVLHESNSFVFSKTNIASAFTDDSDKWARLTNGIQDLPTIFWGYRLEDPGVLQSLSPRSRHGRARHEIWFVTRESNPASDRYLKSLGFNIIWGDTVAFLDYLIALPRPPKGGGNASAKSTKELFPNDCIPDPVDIPARPIAEFYSGSPPDWFDVFSGRLHRTAHAARIENSIMSGKNVVANGMVASGKSTLMMQVAVSLRTRKHKLVCDSLTMQKADLILNKLAGADAVVFVDNFADSIDAFAALSKSDHVQVVGFDRDYLFERASQFLTRSQFDILNVTPLDAADIQAIYERMPLQIRTPELVFPATEGGVRPLLSKLARQCDAAYWTERP